MPAGGPVPASAGREPAAPGDPKLPIVALIDPEQVRAAVTVALDASMAKMIDEVTEKVLLALAPKR